jgi:predicted ATP-binding protein involved in virulence
MTERPVGASRIKRFQVKNLFGTFDHAINLNLEDRITIIHGPNGFGKTVLLQMLQNLFQSHFSKFRRIPFSEFTVSFENGDELIVRKKPVNGPSREVKSPTVHFWLRREGKTLENYALQPRVGAEDLPFPLRMLEREIPELDQIDDQHWLHGPTGNILTLDDVFDLYEDRVPITSLKRDLPLWITRLPAEVDTRLIEANRLFTFVSPGPFLSRRSGRGLKPAVSLYSEDLASLIQAKQSEYGKRSQQLDSSFPARVLKPDRKLSLDLGELKRRLEDLENKRQRIISAGLLAREESHYAVEGRSLHVDETTKNILSLYVQDVDEKLSVFDELTEKIELLKKILNERFAYKKLEVDIKSGFRFMTRHGRLLQPTDLSSGEQHELVLLYELLFKTRENALILIDEPELSLHVAWQVQFLSDLAAVAKLSSFDVLLATHSPQIINDRWDLTVELKGPLVD